VLVVRSARRANRATVDAGGGYTDEKPAVEACVARSAREVAGASIHVHGLPSLARRAAGDWSETDVVILGPADSPFIQAAYSLSAKPFDDSAIFRTSEIGASFFWRWSRA
jgi:hypothetical protein